MKNKRYWYLKKYAKYIKPIIATMTVQIIMKNTVFDGKYVHMLFIAVYAVSGILLAWNMLLDLLEHFLAKDFFLHADITNIDRMDGISFERYLGAHFKKRGYKVFITPPEKDFGVDLVLKKDNDTIAVQAKRYKRSVSYQAIQEIVAGKAVYDCNKAMVITNSYFTPAGRKLAEKNNVELWDRRKLMEVFQIADAPDAYLYM